MSFDEKAYIILDKLIKEFNILPNDYVETISPFTIGIEIEVKFKYYFPNIFENYFKNGKYINFSTDEKKYIDSLIDEEEINIKPLLQKTLECGIEKGKDSYWEFAFPPVNDISILLKQLDVLQRKNLIPNGKHSLHITIGDIKKSKEIYWILSVLQILFCDVDRIKNSFKLNDEKLIAKTWARKGVAGIYQKDSWRLKNSDYGVELRTLEFFSINDLESCFHFLIDMLCKMKKGENIYLVDFLKNEMQKINLPDENWKNPHENPDVWNLYINKFDMLKNKVQNYLNMI